MGKGAGYQFYLHQKSQEMEQLTVEIGMHSGWKNTCYS